MHTLKKLTPGRGSSQLASGSGVMALNMNLNMNVNRSSMAEEAIFEERTASEERVERLETVRLFAKH